MWQPGSIVEDFIKAKSPIIDVLDVQRMTPLAYAALYNNDEALKVLLEHGAKVNLLDGNGSLPLHHALKGSAKTASLLVSWNAKIKIVDGFRQTCLQIAIRSQQEDMVNLIFSYIGDLEPRLDKRGWQTGHPSTSSMIRNRDFHGKTALHRVCASHNDNQIVTYGLIRALIKHGADVDAQDNFGYTPMHVAAFGNNINAMSMLLEVKPNLTLLDQYKCTAMDWASAQGQVVMVEMISAAGGVITQNALEIAATYGFKLAKPEKDYDMEMWSLTKHVDKHVDEERQERKRRLEEEKQRHWEEEKEQHRAAAQLRERERHWEEEQKLRRATAQRRERERRWEDEQEEYRAAAQHREREQSWRQEIEEEQRWREEERIAQERRRILANRRAGIYRY